MAGVIENTNSSIIPERTAELTDRFLCFALLRIAKRCYLKAKAFQRAVYLIGSGERHWAIFGILITSVFYYQSLPVDLFLWAVAQIVEELLLLLLMKLGNMGLGQLCL